jgi:hypothetical protein
MKNLLQIDQSMTKKIDHVLPYEGSKTSLGFLCGRSHISSVNKMLMCLLKANSTIEVVANGLVACFIFYRRFNSLDMEGVLALIESLLEANSTLMDYVTSDGDNILHLVCQHLEGELGVAVLRSFSRK